MLPVTIALGLINFSLLINSIFGTLVSDQAPAAIDKAFRIYMLPQGLFSVAIATILFPTLSRFAARGACDDLRRTMANGVRQICLLLIPSAVLMAVLAEPITRLVYQRGAFGAEATDLVSDGDGLVVDLAAVPGREPAVLAHVLQPPAPVGHHGARRANLVGERRRLRGALRPVRDRRDRARHGGRHGGDVRGAGLDPAPRAARHRGRAAGVVRSSDAAAAALLGAVATASGTASTTLSAARSQARWCRCSPRSLPGRWSTRPRSGCCACPRRGRSAGCSWSEPRTRRSARRPRRPRSHRRLRHTRAEYDLAVSDAPDPARRAGHGACPRAGADLPGHQDEVALRAELARR